MSSCISSVILPKRLHHFLASHRCKETRDISKQEYLQVIDVFHPNLFLPSKLRKGVVIRLYDILVSPYFNRNENFDVDTNTFSYNPALRDLLPPGQLKAPIKTLSLPSHLVKFMAFTDPADAVDATRNEYHEIINIFYPQLNLPLLLSKTRAETLFNITVLPLFQDFHDFEEESGYFSYATHLRILPEPQKKIRMKSIYLPPHLHIFLPLAIKDPAVKFIIDASLDYKVLEMIDLFHPSLQLSEGLCKTRRKGLFDMMVLPYLENAIAFDAKTNVLWYRAVPL